MQFVVHGEFSTPVSAALVRHEQKAHTIDELLGDADGLELSDLLEKPAAFIALLQKKQWNLVTADSDFIRLMYEQKVVFSGSIVLLLAGEGEEVAEKSIDRLFERYKRLTPRRMYTVTGSRVKVRQLPGAGPGAV